MKIAVNNNTCSCRFPGLPADHKRAQELPHVTQVLRNAIYSLKLVLKCIRIPRSFVISMALPQSGHKNEKRQSQYIQHLYLGFPMSLWTLLLQFWVAYSKPWVCQWKDVKAECNWSFEGNRNTWFRTLPHLIYLSTFQCKPNLISRTFFRWLTVGHTAWQDSIN